jgi:hypothetical protein
VIVFPDAEALVLDFLRGAIPGLRCGVELPELPDDAPFLLVIRTGGEMAWPVLDTAAIDLEVWGPDRGTTHDVLQGALGALLASRTEGGPLAFVRVTNAPQWAPDALSGEPRWLASVDVGTRPR